MEPQVDAEVYDWAETPADDVDGDPWDWDVYYTTHALLSRHVPHARRSRVTVLAPDWHTAWKRAAWMVTARHADYYVTRLDCVDWPETA